MYVVKTECQLRMLTKAVPKWQIVYYCLRKWVNLAEFDLLLNKLKDKIRIKKGQSKEPTIGMMDSQSVRW
ncbi:transposase [Emticicia sp. 17c]|uniref:transposase n=1 Tax=Emticicia sp. 17c TaxID=3127704 RepID=UPI003FA5D1FC